MFASLVVKERSWFEMIAKAYVMVIMFFNNSLIEDYKQGKIFTIEFVKKVSITHGISSRE